MRHSVLTERLSHREKNQIPENNIYLLVMIVLIIIIIIAQCVVENVSKRFFLPLFRKLLSDYMRQRDCIFAVFFFQQRNSENK